jgi:hypothetical protein
MSGSNSAASIFPTATAESTRLRAQYEQAPLFCFTQLYAGEIGCPHVKHTPAHG